MSNITDGINQLLHYQSLRIAAIIFTSILAGYTLVPLPTIIERAVTHSNLFKFFILFVLGCVALYPLTISKLINFLFVEIFVLALFDFLRKFDHDDYHHVWCSTPGR